MSGAWAKGANKAVSTAPADDGFQTVGRPNNNSGGGRASGGKSSSLSAAAAATNSATGNNNKNDKNHRNRTNSNSNSGRRSNGGSNGYHNNDDGEGRGGSGGRDGRVRGGGGRGGGRGRGRNSNGNGNNNNNNGGNDHRSNSNRRSSQSSSGGGNNHRRQDGDIERVIHKDVQLLQPGMGGTSAQKSVKRINAKDFIFLRPEFMDVDESRFNPHEECHWTDDDREDVILSLCSKVMELGDVSRIQNRRQVDTAPPLEECTPLEVNEETRWKSKAMAHQTTNLIDETADAPPETEDEMISKALLILNKISWTTLDRLTMQFMEQTKLEDIESMRHKVITILVKKAQAEHHFGAMYAQLCSLISKQCKQFKRDLLEQCQKEFELDTAHKIAKATEGITDPEEIEYHSTLIKKSVIGHIKFLGELYLRNVVKMSVMTYCLDELLKDDTDEESLECFAHLMTTMGEKLDDHAKQNNKPYDWEKIRELRKSNKISSRIKFLLQDLLELKARGWVQRRKTEAAKSLADLHKEVAKEEQAAAKSNRRSSSAATQPTMRRATSLAAAAPPRTDNDGFTKINRASMKKVGSNTNFTPSSPLLGKPETQELRRATSQPVGMDYMSSDSPAFTNDVTSKASTASSLPSIVSPPHLESLLSPDKCSDKMQNILKEYFVGGDTADAVLSIHEMVCLGSDGSIERGAKAVEGGVMLVMEMKEVDVSKFLTVVESCVKECIIESQSILEGLNDPLEFLSDIEIDAPMAGAHLALIVSSLLKWEAIGLEFLLAAPEEFRTGTSSEPAAFGIKVLKKRGGDPTDAELEIIAKLMTEEDKAAHESAKAFFAAS